MNIEAEVIGWLQAKQHLAYADVPATRPTTFITVERIGGSVGEFRDQAHLAIQCWAPTRYEASATAKSLAEQLPSITGDLEQVTKLDITGLYNWPDPEGQQPRYQITATVVSKWNH